MAKKCKAGFKRQGKRCIRVDKIFARDSEKVVKFKLIPHVVDISLTAILILSLFLFDVLQNKFLDFGLDKLVFATSTISFKAINAFWIVFGIYFVVLLTLIVRSIWFKESHPVLDYIVGIITMFGLFLMVISITAGIQGIDTIHWFFNLNRLNLWHLGIAIQILGFLYWLFTE